MNKKANLEDNVQKLINSAIPNKTWMNEAKFHMENREWLRISSKIAVRILRILRKNNLTQKEFARIAGVGPQYINKVIKGKENLSIQTIVKLENALGVKLIEVINENYSTKSQLKVIKIDFVLSQPSQKHDTAPVESRNATSILSEWNQDDYDKTIFSSGDDYVSYNRVV